MQTMYLPSLLLLFLKVFLVWNALCKVVFNVTVSRVTCLGNWSICSVWFHMSDCTLSKLTYALLHFEHQCAFTLFAPDKVHLIFCRWTTGHELSKSTVNAGARIGCGKCQLSEILLYNFSTFRDGMYVNLLIGVNHALSYSVLVNHVVTQQIRLYHIWRLTDFNCLW
jgi:hypothetical protein